MKTLFLNCKLCIWIWQYMSAVTSKLLCFIKKRKLSTSQEVYEGTMPMSIQVHSETKNEEIKLVDWNTWEDEKSVEEEKTQEEIPAMELFKDMEPVINKAKMVHVKQKVKAPSRPQLSPFAFQSTQNNSSFNSSVSFNAQYQVNSELGTWEDDTGGWDDEIDESEIQTQTENMLKQTKQIERERRAEEQRRKRLEKEQLRAQRKQEGHIGVKIS